MPENNNISGKKKAVRTFAALVAVGLLALVCYLKYSSTRIGTDDAFVTGRIHMIAAKISGTVADIPVADNEYVKEGDLLLALDPKGYAARLNEAGASLNAETARLAVLDAQIGAAQARMDEIKASIAAAQANVALQEANVGQAAADLKRAEVLVGKDAISREKYEKVRTAYRVAAAQRQAVREQARQAESSLETQKSAVRQAQATKTAQYSVIRQREASLKTAQLNYDDTRILAPANGYVTRKSVESGDQVGPGQPLLAVVPLDDIWIVANYKETELTRIRKGQRVDIAVDSYPGRKFTGAVDSVMAGTGSAFSLFPSENATGNYVKVVQRIPVKIVLDQKSSPENVLRIGMSVRPVIHVGK